MLQQNRTLNMLLQNILPRNQITVNMHILLHIMHQHIKTF